MHQEKNFGEMTIQKKGEKTPPWPCWWLSLTGQCQVGAR